MLNLIPASSKGVELYKEHTDIHFYTDYIVAEGKKERKPRTNCEEIARNSLRVL